MTAGESPLFSIVTPVLNGMPFIRECVESIRAQGVSLEHIVCDGGSTDGTLEYLSSQEGLTLLPGADRGQGEALVKGFSRVSGRYANWINADERLLSGCLERIAAAFARHPDADVVAGDGRYIDAEGRVTGGLQAMPTDAAMVYFRYYLSQPSTWFTLESFRRCGGLAPELNYCMDQELYTRLLASSRMVIIPETWTDFRLHPGSKSVSRLRMFHREWSGRLLSMGCSWLGESYRLGNDENPDPDVLRSLIDARIEEPRVSREIVTWIKGLLAIRTGDLDRGREFLRTVASSAASVPVRLDAVRDLMRFAWRDRDEAEMSRLHELAHEAARSDSRIEAPERAMLWADYYRASLHEQQGDVVEARRLFGHILALDQPPSCLHSGGARFHLERIAGRRGGSTGDGN